MRERFLTREIAAVGWKRSGYLVSSLLFRGKSNLRHMSISRIRSACPEWGDLWLFANTAVDFRRRLEHDHVFGVQFHPEKSGEIGLQVLSNFCSL